MRRAAPRAEIVLLGQGRFPAVRDRGLAGWIAELVADVLIEVPVEVKKPSAAKAAVEVA